MKGKLASPEIHYFSFHHCTYRQFVYSSRIIYYFNSKIIFSANCKICIVATQKKNSAPYTRF